MPPLLRRNTTLVESHCQNHAHHGDENPSSSSKPSPKTESSPPPGPPANPLNLSLFDVEVLSLLAGFSLFGTLIRLGLTALFTTPKQQVFPIAWVQATGNFLFGFIVERRLEIEAVWPAAYVGLRVGLAGSIATFATFLLQSFIAFSDFELEPDGWLNRATGGLSQILITLSLAFFSLFFGRHAAKHFPVFRLYHSTASKLPYVPDLHAHRLSRAWRLSIVILCQLLCLAAVLTFALSPTVWHPGRRIALSLVMAPLSVWIRWWAGATLNPRSPDWIKLGTFGVNMFSTAVLAVMYLLQRLPVLQAGGISFLGCQALQAVQDGFCGGLSTIPTWLEQVERMHRESSTTKAWLYLIIMYMANLLIVILLLGVPYWTLPSGLISSCSEI